MDGGSTPPRASIPLAVSPDLAHLVSLGRWIISSTRIHLCSVILTYSYRLLPTRRQHRALEAILESQRELYNAALQERISAYRSAGLTRTFWDQTKALTEWRRSDPEGRALPVNLQRGTLKRLDDAYKAFFRRIEAGSRPGFPRFRGKARFDSFGFREFCGVSLKSGRLRFQGMPGSLRVHLHRPLPSDRPIKSCSFRRGSKGWSVSFAIDVAPVSLREGGKAVGVDLGIATFAALSDGGLVPSLRAARKAERRIRVAQRAVARKRPGSRNRAKARLALRRAHAAIGRQRMNHLHSASAQLVRHYDVIAVEALSVLSLAKSCLAKQVHDASWGKFLSMLRYKAAWAGAQLIEVDPRRTSQECSGCGATVPKKLSNRRHECERCGLSIDRDVNAARNILIRAGASPGLPNVAEAGKRAGENLSPRRFP